MQMLQQRSQLVAFKYAVTVRVKLRVPPAQRRDGSTPLDPGKTGRAFSESGERAGARFYLLLQLFVAFLSRCIQALLLFYRLETPGWGRAAA